jgi:hypothetical protein
MGKMMATMRGSNFPEVQNGTSAGTVKSTSAPYIKFFLQN